MGQYFSFRHSSKEKHNIYVWVDGICYPVAWLHNYELFLDELNHIDSSFSRHTILFFDDASPDIDLVAVHSQHTYDGLVPKHITIHGVEVYYVLLELYRKNE